MIACWCGAVLAAAATGPQLLRMPNAVRIHRGQPELPGASRVDLAGDEKGRCQGVHHPQGPILAAPASFPQPDFPSHGAVGADHGFVHKALLVSIIGLDDLREALRKGWANFMAKPSHIVFLGLI